MAAAKARRHVWTNFYLHNMVRNVEISRIRTLTYLVYSKWEVIKIKEETASHAAKGVLLGTTHAPVPGTGGGAPNF